MKPLVSVTDESDVAVATRRTEHLEKAVYQNSALSRDGFLERMFTWMFKGLVYPQIWEDPEIDMEALNLTPEARMLTIASGGCNVLSYLTKDPKEIIAVDLNTAHIALTRLKLTAARSLPNHSSFYRFFGEADEKANLGAYKRFIKDHLDEPTRKYWESRDFRFRRRITLFSRDLYHHGLLGYFIGAGHLFAKLYGIDPAKITDSRSLEEQRTFFDVSLAPLFDKKMVRWVTSKKMSLYGLGIPPAQYEALASTGDGDMASVLRKRLEKLACHFDLNDNYFAWQAFNRGYASGPSGPLPPYLRADHFGDVSSRADRVKVVNRSFTDHLEREADNSMDAYVLLDAQDWMNDRQLNDLWAEITRTAKPGARVIFRTAAEPSLLPGRVYEDVLMRWTYHAEQSNDLHARDRSSIYGGFHIYEFKG